MLEPHEITNILLNHREDGYSVNIHGQVPTDGYMVGGELPSLILDPGEFRPYLTTDEWITDHMSYVAVTGNFVGIWTDTETGKVYIDISRNVLDLYTALAIAESRGEIAIWDVASAKEVRVGFDA